MPSTLQNKSSQNTSQSSMPLTHKRPQKFRWWPFALLLALVVLASSALLLLTPSNTTAEGRLSASLNTHNFGPVKINGGLITTRFPLTVEAGSVVVQSLGTT
jgi:hypothetical protein